MSTNKGVFVFAFFENCYLNNYCSALSKESADCCGNLLCGIFYSYWLTSTSEKSSFGTELNSWIVALKKVLALILRKRQLLLPFEAPVCCLIFRVLQYLSFRQNLDFIFANELSIEQNVIQTCLGLSGHVLLELRLGTVSYNRCRLINFFDVL